MKSRMLPNLSSPPLIAGDRSDTAMSGSLAELYAAIAPCLMGYGEIGKRIKEQGFVADNPYQPWIDVFSSDGIFQAITTQNEIQINTLLAQANPDQATKFRTTIQHVPNTQRKFAFGNRR